jgi:simple sugar transport system substrate-binding protein
MTEDTGIFIPEPGEEPAGLSRGQLLGRAALAAGATGLLGASAAGAATRRSVRSAADPRFTGGKVEKTVAWVQPLQDPVVQQIIFGTYSFAKLRGWKLRVSGPQQFDPQQTLAAIETALATKPDGLVFLRLDPTSFDKAIHKAWKQGTYVITMNQEQLDEDKKGIPIVATPMRGGGFMCATNLCDRIVKKYGKKSGLIIVANFDPAAPFQLLRVGGFKDAVKAYNKANGTNFTTKTEKVSDDPSQALPAFDTIYRRDKDKIVGWGFTGFGWVNMATWIKQNNYKGKFANGGLDIVSAGLPSIRDGYADFTIDQAPYAQGFHAASNLDIYFSTGQPATSMNVALHLVDQSNVGGIMAINKTLQDQATSAARGNWS